MLDRRPRITCYTARPAPRVKSVAELGGSGEPSSMRSIPVARPSPAIIAWDDKPLPGESYTEVVANGLGMVLPMRGKQVAAITRERASIITSLLAWPPEPAARAEGTPPALRASGAANRSLSSAAVTEALAAAQPPSSFSDDCPHKILRLRMGPPQPVAAAGGGRARGETHRRGRGATAVASGAAGRRTSRESSVGDLLQFA